MKDDFVERMARAMNPNLFIGLPDDKCGPATASARKEARAKARAAYEIARPVILEEAAKVARDFAKEPASQFLRKGMGLPYRISAKPLALQAIRIERAIRSLAHTTGQEG